MENNEFIEKEVKTNVPNKISSVILCLITVFAGAASLFLPFFKTGGLKVTAMDLLQSWNATHMQEQMGGVPLMLISYYLDKYFHYLYVLVLVACAFFTLMALLVRGAKAQKQTNKIMFIMLSFMMLQCLLALNYVNVSMHNAPNYAMGTEVYYSLVVGLVCIVIKVLTDAIMCKKDAFEDELREINSTVYHSFAMSFFAILGLICPVYVLPGFSRVFGIDIAMQKPNDFMSFLPLSDYYSTLISLLTVLTIFFFFLNLMFYAISKRLFLHFNTLSYLFALFTIVTYAFMGFCYLLNYIEAGGYAQMLTLALNTYAYVPLLLMLVYQCGYGFTKLANAKVVIQYKIFANAMDESDSSKKPEVITKSKGGRDKRGGTNLGTMGVPSAGKTPEGAVGDPVPAFSELDKKAPQYEQEYQQRLEHEFEDITLPALVEHVIEYAKYSRERLSYGPVEVKTFMAGLAASRLSILQGMSGTGKTSLPKIFMEAIDGFCEIVAIESSWRDKNELLGYYNEFNKKYTPKTFTQYLYKACLNKEVPTFIVLDEMNLSRIEYYFSDFLSLMEARENLRYIKLYDVQLFPTIDEREKYLALRDGHTIDIPTNVWFIGTANRDESTFEISDKVYDRAQTMNFDKRAAKVVITEEKQVPKRYVQYSTLRRLFDESKSVGFNAEKYEAIARVEKLLRPYKISFGNRVLKQMEEFINAYIACSDIKSPEDLEKFTHEAVDCIMFSKVVRKLELKQITDIDALIDEFDALKLPKSVEFLNMLKDSV